MLRFSCDCQVLPEPCRLWNLLPSGEAAAQGPSKHSLAELLGSGLLRSPVLPGVEGARHASVPYPAGNRLAGLVLALEVHPGLPSSGHCLVL